MSPMRCWTSVLHLFVLPLWKCYLFFTKQKTEPEGDGRSYTALPHPARCLAPCPDFPGACWRSPGSLEKRPRVSEHLFRAPSTAVGMAPTCPLGTGCPRKMPRFPSSEPGKKSPCTAKGALMGEWAKDLGWGSGPGLPQGP